MDDAITPWGRSHRSARVCSTNLTNCPVFELKCLHVEIAIGCACACSTRSSAIARLTAWGLSINVQRIRIGARSRARDTNGHRPRAAALLPIPIAIEFAEMHAGARAGAARALLAFQNGVSNVYVAHEPTSRGSPGAQGGSAGEERKVRNSRHRSLHQQQAVVKGRENNTEKRTRREPSRSDERERTSEQAESARPRDGRRRQVALAH